MVVDTQAELGLLVRLLSLGSSGRREFPGTPADGELLALMAHQVHLDSRDTGVAMVSLGNQDT